MERLFGSALGDRGDANRSPLSSSRHPAWWWLPPLVALLVVGAAAAGLGRPGAAALGELRPLAASDPDLAFVAAVLVVLGVLLGRLRPVPGSLATALAAALVLGRALHEPLAGRAVSVSYALAGLLLVYASGVLVAWRREVLARRRLGASFAQYVPPQVVRTLEQMPDADPLAPASRELSVLFADIQGFTALAESLPPAEVGELLNAFFDTASRVLLAHGATIDKFMGDAVMAFWGAPIEQPDHASRAVAAALALAEAVEDLGQRLARKGWPPLALGVGISTGVACVGNLGSSARLTYTAVGDTVNVACRLQQLTRERGVPVLVCSRTARAATGVAFRALGEVRIRGRRGSTALYAPLSAAGTGT